MRRSGSQKGSRTMDRHAEAAGGPRAAVTDLPALLSDDVLAGVLRRLAPWSLAASRCVCKAWQAVIDARRLLRAELLPLTIGGIFINFNGWGITELFSCPSSTTAGPAISGKHDFLPGRDYSLSWSEVSDHCNGLLLVEDLSDHGLHEYVLNPATRWVARLPRCPDPHLEMQTYQQKYLVYDPTVSPHYEVFSITRFQREDFCYNNSEYQPHPVVERFKWPPSVCTIHVFSSRTGQWEERSFVRQGEPAGTVADMRQEHTLGEQHNAVYVRGALYVHCQNGFVMRISLLGDNKYQVIKPPVVRHKQQFFLGKLGKRVCFASVEGRCRIQVWILDESSFGKTEWVLKHDKNLVQWLLKNKLEYARPSRSCSYRVQGPWTLQDINCYYSLDDDDRTETSSKEAEPDESSSQASMSEKFRGSFENDNGYQECYRGDIRILGFHPYEQVIYLGESLTRGLSYNLGSLRSKYWATYIQHNIAIKHLVRN